MLWPKKIHTRNVITKKNSCGLKIPLPPYNFSNALSLRHEITKPQTATVIPWDACGSPTVKIRFGCTQLCKASQ